MNCQRLGVLATAWLLLAAPPLLRAQQRPGEAHAPLPPQPGGVVRMAAAWSPRDLPRGEQLQPVYVNSDADQGAERITLEELEQLALANNPTLPQAARRVQAWQGAYVQAGLCPNPVVGYVGEDIGEAGQAGQQGLAVAQRIITAGKLGLGQSVASREIVKARQDWEMQRQRVLADVRVAAYEVLAAQRTVHLYEQLVHLGQEAQDVAEQLFRAQEVSRVDVLQATIEANSARLQLDNSRTALQAAARKLALVVGLPELETAAIDDRLEQQLPQLAWDEAVAKLLTFSPQLARAQAEVERARAYLALQCAGRIPNLEIETGVRYSFDSNRTVASAVMAVPLQVFDRNQGNIRQAQAELAAAIQEVRRLELFLQDRLAQEFQDYVNASQQVRRYTEQILPDAQDSLDLVRTGYRQGELSYLELLNGQRTFFRVNLAYVDGLRNLWISSTRIDSMLLSGGLNAPGQ